jgi:hypothetical protein
MYERHSVLFFFGYVERRRDSSGEVGEWGNEEVEEWRRIGYG